MGYSHLAKVVLTFIVELFAFLVHAVTTIGRIAMRGPSRLRIVAIIAIAAISLKALEFGAGLFG